jgi:hypothetical protein
MGHRAQNTERGAGSMGQRAWGREPEENTPHPFPFLDRPQAGRDGRTFKKRCRCKQIYLQMIKLVHSFKNYSIYFSNLCYEYFYFNLGFMAIVRDCTQYHEPFKNARCKTVGQKLYPHYLGHHNNCN